MTWNLVSLADVVPSPWKNGGGVTRELVAWPNAQDWTWRLSVAEIAQSGPFSRFEGVHRWFAVLSGAGVRLEVGPPPDAQAHTLTPGSAPLSFGGDAPVFCTLPGGATQDFNLMVRGAAADARMVRCEGEHAFIAQRDEVVAVYALGTGARVRCDDEVLALPPACLAWRSGPAGARLVVTAAEALVLAIAAPAPGP